MRRLKDVLQSDEPAAGASHIEVPAGSAEPAPDDNADPDVCSHCGGGGFVRKELPLGHPEFGRALPCRCVWEERDDVRRERLQRYSNLGPLTRLTFDNLSRFGNSTDPRGREVYQRCVEDAEGFAQDPQGWLVLVGPSGCGKTHIGAAVANRCIESGVPALFVVVPDLLDHLRAAYRPDAEVSYDDLFEQVRNAPVLVLDDVGTQSATPWAQEKLFQLINHRFNARLPTVVTTNVPLKRIDERLRARLADTELARVYEIGERKILDHQNLNMIHQRGIRSMTFENFDIEGHNLPERQRDSLEAAYRGCLTFAQEPDGWIVLTGRPGCGKTHLAAAIANVRLQLGQAAAFVKASRLLQYYRSTFGEDSDRKLSELEEEIENAPLLVVDDLFFRTSSAHKSDWANERLFNLLDYRYDSRLHTVFTTALTEAAMKSDEVGNRFAVRIWDYAISAEYQIKAPAYKQPA